MMLTARKNRRQSLRHQHLKELLESNFESKSNVLTVRYPNQDNHQKEKQ